MTDRNGDGPYLDLDLDRDAWRGLRASTPMSLTAEALDAVRGLDDPTQLSEAVLEQRGLANRKGFPESYDRRALLRFVQQVRAGVAEVTAPVYSHLAYDILPGQRQSVKRPDVLILEGINVLQPAPAGALTLADFFDFSVYVDARTDHIRQWFLSRLHALRDTAFANPQSAFQRLTKVSPAEVDAFGTQVWTTINEVNLVENIQPTRARATLVLHKGADHSVTRVRLRRF